MLVVFQFNGRVARGVSEVIKTKGISYVSILSARKDIMFCAGTPEFHRVFVLENHNLQGNLSINFRINAEVIKLILRSELIDWDGYSDNTYLILEEVYRDSPDDKELLVTVKRLTKDALNMLIFHNKREVTKLSESTVAKNSLECFTIPCGIDYDLEVKLGWYAAYKSDKIKKHDMNMGAALKQLLEVSKIFKTGVCIEAGLAYTDSSKTGIEVYRNIDYAGIPMLLSHSCISELSSFTTGYQELRFFKYGEHMLAAKDDLLLVWRNLRFNFSPNIDELSSQKYLAVFETNRKKMAETIRSISVSKSDNVLTNINFEKGQMAFSCQSKGSYMFSMPFHLIAGDFTDETSKVNFNFRVLRDVMSISLTYNRVRFFIYKHFIRVDFINLYLPEEEDQLSEEDLEGEALIDAEYDSYNKLIIVFGRA